MAEGMTGLLAGRRSRALAHGIAVVLAGVVAAPAAGATFTVTQAGEDANANAAGCPAASPCSLKNALDQAALASNPGLDVIQIDGPFTKAFTNGSGIFVGDASQPVDLRGSGRGTGGTAISFAGGDVSLVAGSSVSDIAFTGASNVLHLDGGATARRISAATTDASAFAVGGGCCTVGNTVLDDVQVSTPAGSTGTALVLNPPAGGSVTATDLDLHAADTDVELSGDGKIVIQRARLTGKRCLFETSAPVFASSVLCVSDAGNPAVEVHKTLDLRDATIVGTSGNAMRGVQTFSGASATVTGSLVRGFPLDVQRGSGSTLSIGTSDFHATSGTPTQTGGNIDADPRFAAPDTGDYRLQRGSPAVDAAGSAPLTPDESATDLRGLPRVDPSGMRDMGAFERQPLTATLTATPDPAAAGTAVTLDASGATYPEAGGIASYAWDLDGDGTFETPGGAAPTLSHVFAPGSRTVHVQVTAGDGATAIAAADVVVTAPPTAASVPAPVAPVLDRTPPAVTASLSAARFLVGLGSSPFSARAARRLPKGTTIHVGLSESATVRLQVLRTMPGRRSGARCVAPTRRTAHARRCTRRVLRGTLARVLPAGASSVAFTGRIGRRALPAGRYVLEIAATDAAGNGSAATTLAFTIAQG